MPDEVQVDTPRIEVDADGIAWLRFDVPGRSLNVFTRAVIERTGEAIRELTEGAASGAIRGVVVWSDKPDSFFAGADVDLIAGIEDPVEGRDGARTGQRMFDELEALAVPTVAAVHGVCVGGGLEMALACRYRVASDSDDTKLGLPEVQLGLLPGWGGTTRLPRLIGLQASLDLILTGRSLSAGSARRKGLVDAVFPSEQFRREVGAFALDRVERGPVPTGARRSLRTRILEDTAPVRALVLRTARKRVLARTGGHYPAPLRILDVVGTSYGRPVPDALLQEAEAFGELVVTRTSKNLIHVFRLRESGRKGRPWAPGVEPRPVDRVGILGAGVMGGGIAQLAAYSGLEVRLKDIRHEAVGHALQVARSRFDEAVERRKLSRREAAARMQRIGGGLDYAGFRQADLVIEAVVERMDVKRSVLAELEGVVRADTIVASNTSSLSIDAMAGALSDPSRFCGMHFFNPVHRMPLVEVVRGEATSDTAIATVVEASRSMGKVPVVVRDGPGFVVNRILAPYLNEAGFLLGDGADVERIDRVGRDFGMPMGPLRLIDEVGIDIAGHAGRSMHEAFGDRMAPAPALVRIGETGRLGRKGGGGFYRYEGDRETGVDLEAQEDAGFDTPEGGGPDPEQIADRLVLAMVNEAARVLSDGIVEAAGDLDLAMIMGTGFPPFRGGLLRHADAVHPRAVLDRLRELAETVGPRFEPAPLLQQLARDDRGFYEAF